MFDLLCAPPVFSCCLGVVGVMGHVPEADGCSSSHCLQLLKECKDGAKALAPSYVLCSTAAPHAESRR
jgi:hypothetical protein